MLLDISQHRQSIKSRLGVEQASRATALSILIFCILLVGCAAPHPVNVYCMNLGGQPVSPPDPNAEGEFVYCAFPDGSGCYGSQFYDETCIPPGMDTPILESDMNRVVAPLLVMPPISSPPPAPPIESTDVPPTSDPVAPPTDTGTG